MNVNSDIETVAEIKSEVRKFMSDKSHIVDAILYNEAVEDYKHLREALVAPDDEISDDEFSDLEVP